MSPSKGFWLSLMGPPELGHGFWEIIRASTEMLRYRVSREGVSGL